MKQGHKRTSASRVHWLLEEASTAHVSTALEAKVIKPAERDKMQRQGILPGAWCDDNMVTLPFSGLQHGQSWPASATVCVVNFPNPNPSTGAWLGHLHDKKSAVGRCSECITSLVPGQHVHWNML